MTRTGWIAAVVALIVGVAIGASGSSTDDNTQTVTETIEASATPEPSAPVTEEPEPEATADIETETRCAYNLDTSATSSIGGQFVGEVEATNDGDGDGRVRATASWDRLGNPPVRQTKTFTVRAGESRSVQFNVTASIDDIGTHQSADSDCRITVKPVGGGA